MKKETGIAIFLGILLGGLIAIFLVSKNSDTKLEKNKAIAPTVSLEKEVKNEVIEPINFELIEPMDKQIVTSNSINIKVKVQKNSLVVIQSPVGEKIMKATNTTVSTSFPLALGENSIKIVAYPSDKNSRLQEKQLQVYYLDSQL